MGLFDKKHTRTTSSRTEKGEWHFTRERERTAAAGTDPHIKKDVCLMDVDAIHVAGLTLDGRRTVGRVVQVIPNYGCVKSRLIRRLMHGSSLMRRRTVRSIGRCSRYRRQM